MRRLVAQDHQVFTEDGKTVAIFGDGIMLTDNADWEQRKADAILFSASPAMLAALIEIEAALRKDSRDKSIHRDTVEYHLDGQAMYSAINRARIAIAEATAATQVQP
jgi:hypothetical protein